MFSLDNISMHYGRQEIFRNVSAIINPRDRIGLVGRNGAGKTTLLRIIEEYDEGQGASWNDIIQQAGEAKINRDTVENVVADLFEKGMVYEPLLGKLKRI